MSLAEARQEIMLLRDQLRKTTEEKALLEKSKTDKKYKIKEVASISIQYDESFTELAKQLKDIMQQQTLQNVTMTKLSSEAQFYDIELLIVAVGSTLVYLIGFIVPRVESDALDWMHDCLQHWGFRLFGYGLSAFEGLRTHAELLRDPNPDNWMRWYSISRAVFNHGEYSLPLFLYIRERWGWIATSVTILAFSLASYWLSNFTADNPVVMVYFTLTMVLLSLIRSIACREPKTSLGVYNNRPINKSGKLLVLTDIYGNNENNVKFPFKFSRQVRNVTNRLKSTLAANGKTLAQVRHIFILVEDSSHGRKFKKHFYKTCKEVPVTIHFCAARRLQEAFRESDKRRRAIQAMNSDTEESTKEESTADPAVAEENQSVLRRFLEKIKNCFN